MNVGTIYANATGKGRLEPPQMEAPNPAEVNANQQITLQTKLDWIRSIRTQEVFVETRSKVTELETEARKLAVNYHNHGNHQQIIQKLVEANILREFINTYASAT